MIARMNVNAGQIARVAHETNRAYCETIEDYSQKSWEDAEPWQRESAMKGVEFALAHPGAHPKDQHEAWSKDKLACGWKYGPVKDAVKLEHPCLVPYGELPIEQRMKDYLFRGVVFAFQMCGTVEEARSDVPSRPSLDDPAATTAVGR
jgi:hypothetical protein